MTAYPGTTYIYVSIDADHDISTSTLQIGPALTSLLITAAYVPAPSTRLTTLQPLPKAGFTRYWWQFLAGTGQTLTLSTGENIFYGQLADTPESVPQRWQLQLQGFTS